MPKSFEERMENLAFIEETLKEERAFYLGQKDWPRVKVRSEALKLQKEQVARLRFAKAA